MHTTILILELDSLYQTTKSIKTLQELKDKCFILNSDKDGVIVLNNRDDYNNLLENLFNGISRFQRYDHDPTI